MTGLKAITVYLPEAEVDALNREAEENGRSGASAQIRFLLGQRRAGISEARPKR